MIEKEILKNSSLTELNNLKIIYQKKLKHLKGKKKYYNKQKGKDVKKLQEKISEVKQNLLRIEKEICKRKRIMLETYSKQEIEKEEDKLFLQNIMTSFALTKEEKSSALQEKITILESIIQVYQKRIADLKIDKKINFENFKDYNAYHQNEREIKETKIEILHLKDVLQMYRSAILSLEDKPCQMIHTKHPVVKEPKENDYYFVILNLLLNNHNYLLLCDLLQQNESFLKAFLEKEDIFKEEDTFMKIKEQLTQKEDIILNKISHEHFDKEIANAFLEDTLGSKNRVDLTNTSDTDYRFIGHTFHFENQRYAFSYGYDKDFYTYFRISVLDTSFLPENSALFKEMAETPFEVNQCLKKHFGLQKSEHLYPSFTYQFKISPKGEMTSFKIFESKIKIDEEIKNADLYHYRENEELKFIISSIKFLMQNYQIEETLNSSGIEMAIDEIINEEVKKYILKNNLPAIYYTEIKKTEEEKYKEHSNLAYYLSKIPKKEFEFFLNLLEKGDCSRFYSATPLEESKLFLNPYTYIGLKQLQVLKLHLKEEQIFNYKSEYRVLFRDLINRLNEEYGYIDEETKMRLEKKKKEK